MDPGETARLNSAISTITVTYQQGQSLLNAAWPLRVLDSSHVYKLQSAAEASHPAIPTRIKTVQERGAANSARDSLESTADATATLRMLNSDPQMKPASKFQTPLAPD